MRDKKSKSSSLERKRFIFLEIGMIIVLSAILLAFNYRSYPVNTFLDFDRAPRYIDQDFAPNTIQRPPQPPAPPTPAPSFNIIDDKVDIETNFKINVEDNQKKAVEAWTPFIPDEIPDPEPEPFIIVEQEPTFPGGEIARRKFLLDNIIYPMAARETGVSGTVYIKFVVEPDGRISNVDVLRGPGAGLNDEAVRVAYLMPNWNPGIQQGKAVRVLINMPIEFVLK
jgi:protein TonB